jgi:hypothetical protein
MPNETCSASLEVRQICNILAAENRNSFATTVACINSNAHSQMNRVSALASHGPPSEIQQPTRKSCAHHSPYTNVSTTLTAQRFACQSVLQPLAVLPHAHPHPCHMSKYRAFYLHQSYPSHFLPAATPNPGGLTMQPVETVSCTIESIDLHNSPKLNYQKAATSGVQCLLPLTPSCPACRCIEM